MSNGFIFIFIVGFVCYFNSTTNKMVQTRRSAQKFVDKTPNKANVRKNRVGKKNKTQFNLDRCKNWIQQQKKEKLKVQPDDLESNESDEEARDINLAAISVMFQCFPFNPRVIKIEITKCGIFFLFVGCI